MFMYKQIFKFYKIWTSPQKKLCQPLRTSRSSYVSLPCHWPTFLRHFSVITNFLYDAIDLELKQFAQMYKLITCGPDIIWFMVHLRDSSERQRRQAATSNSMPYASLHPVVLHRLLCLVGRISCSFEDSLVFASLSQLFLTFWIL